MIGLLLITTRVMAQAYSILALADCTFEDAFAVSA